MNVRGQFHARLDWTNKNALGRLEIDFFSYQF